MKTLAIISLVTALGLLYVAYTPETSNYEDQFTEFIATYGRNYGSEGEYSFRRSVFEANMKTAEELDRLHPEASFGMTPLSDLTQEEMNQRMGLIDPMRDDEDIEIHHAEEGLTWASLDYSSIMQPIQNQGNCGSCWAFSGVASFEARWAIHGGAPYKASDQQALDCSAQPWDCTGGWYEDVWMLGKRVGLCPANKYQKYVAIKQVCKFCQTKPSKDTGFVRTAKTEEAIYSALQQGPLSIAVDASVWPHYRGGILTRASCGTGMSHAVNVIAYNEAENTWKVRNHWGPAWGEAGNVRLRAKENTCNLLYKPAYPTF